MERIYFKSVNGYYYTETDVRQSLDIICGRPHNNETLTVEGIIKLINNGIIRGLLPETFKPSIEDFIRSGDTYLAVREYYFNYNENHPNNKIRLTDARDYIKKIEEEIMKCEDKNNE